MTQKVLSEDPPTEQSASPAVPDLVLDAFEQAILAIDRERRVVYANSSCEELLGATPEDLVGLPVAKIFPGLDAKWLRAGSREPREFRVHTEGRDATLKVEAYALPRDGNTPRGFVLTADALSETEGGEFQKKIDRLVSLGQLSAYVAHEIRNPLTGIRTTVQYVSSKLRPRDSRREDLADVIKELDRIEQIITGLLLFARPQSGNPSITDVHSVLDKTLDNVSLQFEDGSVEVEKDYADDLPQVWIDTDLLQQVFLNLCLNALQAMPTGGQLSVTTSARRPKTRKHFVDVSFTDSGPGIADGSMEKIFDPFFTTRSMGTGLGLSISLQIVRDAGGVITARNNAAGGATFRVSLPIPQEPAAADEA